MSQFSYLDTLTATIAARAGEDATHSYTAQLLHKGPLHIGKKVGEEGVEVAIAVTQASTENTILESADLLFHLLVLWQAMGITPGDVMAELVRRQGQSGIAEKASRMET